VRRLTFVKNCLPDGALAIVACATTKFAARAEEKKVTRRSIGVVLAALVGCLPVAGAAHRGGTTPSSGLGPIAYGSPAPDFAFDADDGTHRLADFAGKPVVVNFWATWCHPCDDELEAFAELRRTYGDAVPLLAISEERRDVAAAFLRAHGVDAVAIADPDHKIFERYGVAPIPVTVVLNRAGAVTHVSVGELDWPELEAAIEQASGPTPEPTPT
jgi:cytochrome c biogenesis protein CcmG, thiol:disulfide interchange protein DsbE